MSEILDDLKDPNVIVKMIDQLLAEGRITPAEHKAMEAALHRYSSNSMGVAMMVDCSDL